MGKLDRTGDAKADGAAVIRGPVQAANMLRALANPHRLQILRLLDQAPHTVMDLCERLSLRQSLASQHLARLRLDGIVAAERQGHHVIYSFSNARARAILDILDVDRPASSRKAGRTGVAEALDTRA
ncbi:metalloregulator ArsR/SmtB family transcription factor [Rhodomicrobium sp. Az07]|uniref:ArsR/SmtB family transcription factor n=1 Tax=Rhodomicrobium sp. Az07 TaxID=2839034 RepID=UPI001BE9BD58|nr:metalloregulator ArsR/SmtB family transcription factor [Rhodomicrobium sp. Az07]MBT3069813.1 metalloregulator ArsR/SmtB family transcription factor [Rhodomicrobium sp. Az07]